MNIVTDKKHILILISPAKDGRSLMLAVIFVAYMLFGDKGKSEQVAGEGSSALVSLQLGWLDSTADLEQ